MNSYTTIQISPQTRERLSGLKEYKRETYDEILNRLLALVPEGDEEGKYSAAFRAGLLRGLIDIQNKRAFSHEEVKKHLGLK